MANPALASKRSKRREAEHAANRTAILEAARRVALHEGAVRLSLRSVAAEAGYVPAALYGYFRNKNELLLALAAEDLSDLTRRMRDASHGSGGLAAAATAALDILRHSEPIAAMSSAFEGGEPLGDAERHFNGRMIAALMALSQASGMSAQSRESQADTVLIAAALSGLALLARSGRLAALGFTPEEMLASFERRFAAMPSGTPAGPE
jgi:AcrR family transcriptional regulator